MVRDTVLATWPTGLISADSSAIDRLVDALAFEAEYKHSSVVTLRQNQFDEDCRDHKM
jgi:hypothetical protein